VCVCVAPPLLLPRALTLMTCTRAATGRSVSPTLGPTSLAEWHRAHVTAAGLPKAHAQDAAAAAHVQPAAATAAGLREWLEHFGRPRSRGAFAYIETRRRPRRERKQPRGGGGEGEGSGRPHGAAVGTHHHV
jgi:hypothetical protein